MISLSSALSPAVLRVPGNMAAAAPAGDFATTLAGVLVPSLEDIEPSLPPAAPSHRQTAAAPGKDLPGIAAAADTTLSPVKSESIEGVAPVDLQESTGEKASSPEMNVPMQAHGATEAMVAPKHEPAPPPQADDADLPDAAARGVASAAAADVTRAPPILFPAQTERALIPSFVEKAVRSPDQPVPPITPIRSRHSIDPEGDVANPADMPAPTAIGGPTAVDGEASASVHRAESAPHRVPEEKRGQTRKGLIAALPLPIPTPAGAAAAQPVMTAANILPTAAPAIERDIAAPTPRLAAPTPTRGRKVEPAEHDARSVVADGIPIARFVNHSGQAPVAGPAIGTRKQSSETPSPKGDRAAPAPSTNGRASDAVPVHAPVVLEAGALPVIIELAGTPASVDAPPAAPRPLRFSISPDVPRALPRNPAPGPSVARPLDTGAVRAARAAAIAPPEIRDFAAMALRPTAAEPTIMAARPGLPVSTALPSSDAASAALPRVAAARSHPTAPLRADVGTAPAPAVPTVPTSDAADRVVAPMPGGVSTASPALAARSTSSAEPVRMAPNRRDPTLPARATAQAIAPSGATASLQPLAPLGRPVPVHAPAVASRPSRPEAAGTDAIGPMIAAPHTITTTPAVEQAAAAHRTPLDMRHDDWTQQLIDRIEHVRDIADAADTRIKLAPDALGKIDVSMRKDGDTVHVTFTADVAQTRAILAEAQPRLAELAAQRGLRLGQSSVDAGAGGQGQQQQQAAGSPAPLPSRPVAARDEDLTETGRVA